jgi:endo-1,4-beta-xylanase
LAGATVAAGLSPCLRAGGATLKALAHAAGLYFGTDSDTEIATAPAEYGQAIAAQCDLLAPNLGWRRVAAAVGAAEPGWEDPNIGFARDHGLRLTGGHLLWHETLPQTFLDTPAGGPARAAAASHIRQLAAHYAGQVYSWNVVNEAIDPEHGDGDGMRRSPLSEQLGPGYIEEAFKLASSADPSAVLVYNETNLEMDTRQHAARRDALLRLLDRLQRAAAPIHAVGLQSHLRLDGTRFDPLLYRRFLTALAGRGLRILITELDVSDIAMAGGVAARDRGVAALYAAFLAVALDQPAVASLVVWGMSDRYTWLTPATNARFRRADGLPARPLPLDADFQPKPAFNAIATALLGAPKRVPLASPK